MRKEGRQEAHKNIMTPKSLVYVCIYVYICIYRDMRYVKGTHRVLAGRNGSIHTTCQYTSLLMQWLFFAIKPLWRVQLECALLFTVYYVNTVSRSVISQQASSANPYSHISRWPILFDTAVMGPPQIVEVPGLVCAVYCTTSRPPP